MILFYPKQMFAHFEEKTKTFSSWSTMIFFFFFWLGQWMGGRKILCTALISQVIFMLYIQKVGCFFAKISIISCGFISHSKAIFYYSASDEVASVS